MKKFGKQLVLAAGLAFGASANAAPITDLIEFTPPEFVDYGDSLVYSHNLNDDGFALGSAISGSISISFTDDSSIPGGPAGVAEFFFELGTDFATIVVDLADFDTGTIGFPINGTSVFTAGLDSGALGAVNSSGFLNVVISGFLGLDDFYVNSSSLTIDAEVVGSPVPVPATLGLFGLGLLVLGATRKQKRAA